MAHRLRAKVQFSAIDKIKTNLKSNINSVLIVIDHKQKVLQQRYREGQVEYYGKKGMSVLGVMIVQWDREKIGYVYKFENIIFKGYSGQDNVQVAAALKLIIHQVHTNLPDVNEIVMQRDNT